MKQRVDAVVRAFETLTPESVDRLGEVYATDARFTDPFNEVQGIAEIQRIFRHMYQSLEAPRFEVHARLLDGDQCFLTWDFSFCFRSFYRGKIQTVRGSSHLAVNRDGLVCMHRDYWDAAQELYEKMPVVGSAMRWLRRRANS